MMSDLRIKDFRLKKRYIYLWISQRIMLPLLRIHMLNIRFLNLSERVVPKESTLSKAWQGTTGVLLLTNDGDLAGKLTHPKYKRRKIYHVFLDSPVTKNDLFKLTEGIELDGLTVVADAVSYADPDDKSQIGIELHSGQNRVVRRMFETLGYKVKNSTGYILPDLQEECPERKMALSQRQRGEYA